MYDSKDYCLPRNAAFLPLRRPVYINAEQGAYLNSCNPVLFEIHDDHAPESDLETIFILQI